MRKRGESFSLTIVVNIYIDMFEWNSAYAYSCAAGVTDGGSDWIRSNAGRRMWRKI